MLHICHKEVGEIYFMMIFAVCLRQCLAPRTKTFFVKWIYEEILTNCMPCELPGKQISIAFLVVGVPGDQHFIGVFLKLAMILDNGSGERRCSSCIGRSLEQPMGSTAQREHNLPGGKHAVIKHDGV